MLWPEFRRIPWDDRSPIELLFLFTKWQARHRAELVTWSKDDDQRYAELLSYLIITQFKSRRWFKSLRYILLDPEDVAMQVLEHLFRKTRTMKLRHPDQWKVLIKVLNTAIYFFVMTVVQGAVRHHRNGRELATTDYFHAGGSAEVIEAREDPAKPADDLDLASLGKMLRLESVVDRIIGDVPTRTARQAEAIEAAYDWLVENLLAGCPQRTWDDLPEEIRKEASVEQHALILARLTRTATAQVAGCG